MSKFTKYISDQELKDYNHNLLSSIKIDEGINRNIIIKQSDFIANIPVLGSRKADYEWTVGNIISPFFIYYLFSNEKTPNYYEFKFVTHDLKITKTGDLKGKPATSIFSGAILAIKEFLDNHKTTLYFSIDASTHEFNRISLYKTGSKILAKETGFKYLGEITDDPSFVKFVFKKEE